MEAPVADTITNPPSTSNMSGNQHQQADASPANGIQLPKQLEAVKVAQVFPVVRHRWNTNEEIASILIAFSKHVDWQYHDIKMRPPSGCMLLFNRNSVRYRKDGYCWKKRKDGKSIREDHMKLKVQGLECIYGSYVHSAILPTFHRRCFWLLQNPDIVLVHYLNVPYPNSTKLSIPVVTFAMEKKEWTKEELVDQLTPMFSSLDSERIPAIDETILTLVQRLIENREKHNQEIKADNSGRKCCHGKSASGGEPVVNIQPEGATFKPLHECCGGSSGTHTNSQSNFNNAMFNQAQDLQNRIDLAQGPLILNLGNLTGRGVMVVTHQTNAAQLSILTNTSNSGQLQNWSYSGPTTNSQPAVSQMKTLTETAASQNASQNLYEQTAAQQMQHTQNINCSSYTTASNPCQTSNVNGLQHQTDDVNNAASCRSNRASCAQENNTCNIENNPIISMQHMDSARCLQNQEQNTSRLYQSLTPEAVSHDVETIDSLVEELNLELMATSKTVSNGNPPKQGFGHLGDSFDSLQASLSSLQGSDLNLDQLDLIDLPEFEKICNDISNNSNIDLSNNSNIDLSNNSNSEISNNSHMNSHSSQGDNCQRNFDTDTNLSGVNLNNVDVNSVSLSRQNSGSQNFTDQVGNNTGSVKSDDQMTRSGSCPPGHQAFHSRGDNLMHTTKSPSTIAMITDFSPDWAYVEGQTKVLVTGPWHSHLGTYSVLLDGKVVATTLVQPGVLRCFVPGHPTGLVSLQVSCDGTMISNTVAFQYKDTPKHVQETRQTQADWFSVDDCRLQQQLVDKIDRIESALSKIPDCLTIKQTIHGLSSLPELDTCLTHHIESLSTRLWTTNDLSIENGSMGLSLLHLAAGLGCHRVIKSLINWRNENSTWILEYEVDAHSTDLNSCTPLMWACARGYTEAAIILYNWNKSPLHSFNREGNLPLFVARQHGHHTLADQLEQLDSSGDLTHGMTSSNQSHSNENISSASIYSSRSFDDSRSHHVPLCSDLNAGMSPVSSVCSVSENTFLPTEYPAASSTPILKEKPASPEIFKSPQLRSKSGKALSALHIDIPLSKSVTDVNAQCNQQQMRDKLLRRQSDQMLKVASTSTSALPTSSLSSMTSAEKRQKLKKRLSVDILPYEMSEPAVHFSPTNAFQRPIREANSEPHLSAPMEHLLCESNPMLSEGREMVSPELLVQMEGCDRLESDRQGTSQNTSGQPVNMDTDNLSDGSGSSYIDVERVSSDDENIEELKRKMLSSGNESEKIQMVHLAKQIIAAMPERIKSSPSRTDDAQPDEFERERSNSHSSLQSASPHASSSYGETLSSYGEDSGISTPMRDSLAFDEYRYADVYSDLGTPASSLSPDSTCLHSPYSPYSFQLDSPPPTAAEFVEYFNAPATYMEKDFSQLTLSDIEQRKLYEAAKVIQSAYRQYRDKQCKQQNKEIEAAILIQSYYRRYKQYAYYKKMTQAAVLIQSQFRSYYAQKRFKKSRDAAVVIQNQYRSYKEHERLKKGGNKSVIQRYRSHYQRKPAGAGAGKGSRVVQLVPDTGDGSQPEQANTAIDECPPDTSSNDMVKQSEDVEDNQHQVTPNDGTQGE